VWVTVVALQILHSKPFAVASSWGFPIVVQTAIETVTYTVTHMSFVGESMVNGLLFHMTQPTSRSIIKAIACSKPTISEH